MNIFSLLLQQILGKTLVEEWEAICSRWAATWDTCTIVIFFQWWIIPPRLRLVSIESGRPPKWWPWGLPGTQPVSIHELCDNWLAGMCQLSFSWFLSATRFSVVQWYQLLRCARSVWKPEGMAMKNEVKTSLMVSHNTIERALINDWYLREWLHTTQIIRYSIFRVMVFRVCWL